MSRFLCPARASLESYVPGEQPRDRKYIKLNTNESPFPPSPATLRRLTGETMLNLYPDPTCAELTGAIASLFGLQPENVILGNGSDEILAFAFLAFCDGSSPALFSDITYGFYPVFAELFGVPYSELALRDDLTVETEAFCRERGTVVLANPQCSNGYGAGLAEIERILRAHPDNVCLSTRLCGFRRSFLPRWLLEKLRTLLSCKRFPNRAPWQVRGWVRAGQAAS
jgi:histidinol-phosphate aminotransferase